MQFSATTDSSQENHVPNAFQATHGYDMSVAKKDSCTCFTQVEDGEEVYAWTGNGCSLRTCPFGAAFDGTPISANNHNQLVECSNRGDCDRKSGQCICYAGYEGKGCRRT